MIDLLKKNRFFLFGVTVFLFFAFTFNVFGVVTTDEFTLNFKDSESLVSNQIVCKGSLFSGQLLGYIKAPATTDTEKSCVKKNLEPYSSQFGLQGRSYTLLYKALSKVSDVSPRSFILIAQLMTALASSVTLALLVLWVKLRIGRPESIIVTLLLALSPMLVSFARNLYWALPLMFVPLIFTLFFYRYKTTEKYQVTYNIILGVLLFLRFLNGYEYVTSITIMIAAAVGYFLYIENKQLNDYVKEFAKVFVVTLIAFSSALGVHIVALQGSTGSISKSVEIIKSRAVERTTASASYLTFSYGNLKQMAPDVYELGDYYVDLEGKSRSSSELGSNAVALLNYALLPVFRLPLILTQPFSTLIYSVTMFTTVLGIIYIKRKSLFAKKRIRQVGALYVSCAIGFIGFLSWLILARSHSLVHAHINGILLYLPFAIFGYIILSIYLHNIIRRVIRR